MPKLTDWFPMMGATPEYTGVYEVQTVKRMEGGTYRYFDGEHWYYGEDTPDDAMKMFQMAGIKVREPSSTLAWRGRAQP